MKRATVKITVELEISYSDVFDDDWVREQYLSSPRCSIEEQNKEVGYHTCSSAGVDLIRRSDVVASTSARTNTPGWWRRVRKWIKP